MTKYEYQYKRRNDLGIVLMIFLLTLVAIGSGRKNDRLEVKAITENPPVQIVERVVYEVPKTFEEYVAFKFGESADEAFLLLKGNGAGSCAENRNLDPNQDNDNRTWGGVGVDRGYWQINSHFHPSVTEVCARDVQCSTDYAYKLFVNSGYKFTPWTCGKVYGI